MAAVNFPASPTNGQQFVAAGVTWTWDGAKWTALGNNLGIPDAPSDGQLYGRKNASWSLATGGGGGIGDAPTDGAAYARKSGGWATLTHLDITDWAANVPAPSSTSPAMDGTAAIGTGTTYARADHKHPSDTSKYDASNPAGYQTAAQVTASLGSYLPVAGGTITGGLAVNGTASFLGSMQVLGASPQITLNKTASGGINNIVGQTAGANRWSMQMGSGVAEGGSSTGSAFALFSWTDAQVASVLMSGARATNQMSFTVAIVNGPSDRTLKENIAPLEGSLDKVLALQGVGFNMIATPNKPEIGLIAQDVAPIVPEILQPYPTFDAEGKSGEDKLALDYPKLTALLIEAVKELAAKVAILEAKA